MTCEQFLVVFDDMRLREYVKREARRYSKNEEVQKDLQQEAWLRIGAEPSGQRSIECYQEQADKAIHTAYYREYRNRKAEERYLGINLPDCYSDRYA